jgi:hypothetical protein
MDSICYFPRNFPTVTNRRIGKSTLGHLPAGLKDAKIRLLLEGVGSRKGSNVGMCQWKLHFLLQNARSSYHIREPRYRV